MDSSSVNNSSSSSLDLANITSWDWNEIWNNIINWCKSDGLRYFVALIICIILFIINNFIARGIRKTLRKNPKTEACANAVYRTVRVILNIIVLILFLGYIGVEMTGISSIIASCAVAIGLALQGSLSNIAGWVIIIVTRPFKLGDYVTAQNQSGTVEEINLFFTHLKTPDNKVIYIPNGQLSNGVIVNVSSKDRRRLDEVFSISYDEDPIRAINVIKKVISKNKQIITNPEPFVRVSEYADSSVNITVRVWVKSQDYWDVHWDLLQDVKKAFDDNDITIPFNQYDVNIVTKVEEKKKKSTSKKTKAK